MLQGTLPVGVPLAGYNYAPRSAPMWPLPQLGQYTTWMMPSQVMHMKETIACKNGVTLVKGSFQSHLGESAGYRQRRHEDLLCDHGCDWWRRYPPKNGYHLTSTVHSNESAYSLHCFLQHTISQWHKDLLCRTRIAFSVRRTPTAGLVRCRPISCGPWHQPLTSLCPKVSQANDSMPVFGLLAKCSSKDVCVFPSKGDGGSRTVDAACHHGHWQHHTDGSNSQQVTTKVLIKCCD